MILQTGGLAWSDLISVPTAWQLRSERFGARKSCVKLHLPPGPERGLGKGSANPSRIFCLGDHRPLLGSVFPSSNGGNAAPVVDPRQESLLAAKKAACQQLGRHRNRFVGQSGLVHCSPDSGSSFVHSDEASTSDPASSGPDITESNGHSGLSSGDGLEGLSNSARSDANGEAGVEGASDGPIRLEGEDPVAVLKDLLQVAQQGLERSRKRSEELEEEAQKIAERALALRDEAAEAEKQAAGAESKVKEIAEQELVAQETLEKAEAAYALAEEASAEAETELGAALRTVAAAEGGAAEQTLIGERAAADVNAFGELRIGPRFEMEAKAREAEGFKRQAQDGTEEEGQESSNGASVAAWQQAFEQAQAELNSREQELLQAKSELQRLGTLKAESEQAVAELEYKAKSIRAEANSAEDRVAKAMELAEKAVGREVEACHIVNDAEKALAKAEKLAAELEQAAAEEAAKEKVEKLAAEVAEAAALLAKEEPEDFKESKENLNDFVTVMDKANARIAVASDDQREEKVVAAESLDNAVAASARPGADPVVVTGGVAKEVVLDPASKEKEKEIEKDIADEKDVEAPVSPKPSSTKKSSRFYAASYFSSADDGELSLGEVVSDLFLGIKKQLPKIVLALALVFASGAVINARMEKKMRLQPPEAGATLEEVAPTAKPLIAELKKIPTHIKSAIDKLPRHEPNEEETQLFDVLWLLLASVVFVPIFQKLPGGSPVLGYLAAGALIGPYALSIIQHVHGTKALAEFGVVFLMFNIGLELSLERLRSMKKYVFGLGTAQVLVTALVIGLFVSTVSGVSGNAALVIGNGLALSSTAVVLQVLQERGESTSRHGRATFSVLLFQDLAVVVLLILIPLLSPDSSGGGRGVVAILEALGIAALKAVVAIAGIIAGGRLLLRPIYKRMAEGHNNEIFAANTLLVVLGTSVLTARAGLSMALGAFLAGVLLAETEYALQVESDINPYRGLLLGLFFMTVGMSIDPKLLIARFPMICGAIALLIVGKTLLIAGIGRAFGLSFISGVRAGLLLAPGGEFAFVAFGEAVQKGIMTQQTSALLFLIVGISMAITPYLAAGGQLIASKFEQQDVRSLLPDECETDDLQGHVIICGFGRVGQIIAQLLSERLIPFVALDVSSDTVSAGRALDLPVYFGDAGSRDVLHKVGAERAAAAVIALDTPGANYRTVWALTKNFPHLKTFVRAHDIDHGLTLEKAGATAVVPETLEPSLQLAAAVLAQVKMPAADIASAIDEFRMRHLSELTELSTISKTSLGYGYSKLLASKAKPKSQEEGGSGAVDVIASSVSPA